MTRSLTLIVFTLFSCQVRTPMPRTQSTPYSLGQAFLSEAPDWVKQKPVSAKYYTGIGTSSLTDPDFQSNAKLNALDDLASEISVQIESASLLYQIENSQGYQENFRAGIKSSVSKNLTSYELKGSWKGKGQYWIMYQLDKEMFRQIEEEKRDATVALARGNFIAGRSAKNKGDFVQAMHFFAKCIDDLSARLHEKIEVEIEDEIILLSNEAYREILNIAGSFSLTTNRAEITFSVNENDQVIVLRAESNGNPVTSLPITLVTATWNKELTTNRAGSATLTITNKQISDQHIRAGISLSFLEENLVVYELLKKYPLPTVEISIERIPPSFFIQSNEINLGNPLEIKVLNPLFKKILSKNGYRLSEKKNKADFLLVVNSNSRNGAETSGLYSSYVDFSFTVRNADDGIIIYSNSYSGIKGLHTSFEEAGLKAYQAIEEVLFSEINEAFQKNLFFK